ncbi:uncharacterized protein B0I36DRAFT_319684 [Microdochium trichocladiopsis]|uniref:Rhodopsin domain-containing protein n=1 Tax=Microdochium trichocladiopsis TaxID=1682393 RepID=A0A9P8Y892_9PEZI|nr:uncharacterized protein B0I36DRAFT_319684 [Microdochium trichocladiopsis]KAH7032600.1 hypothetical protein B0I36DRAFT_319684 [Microdochium trichocladiopsis]
MAPPQPLPPDAYDSRANSIIAVVAAGLFISSTAVALRFYVRLGIVKKFGPDDWGVAIFLVFVLVLGILAALNTASGLGRHISVLSHDEIVTWWKENFFALLAYQLAIASGKVTFLLQFRRIFPLPHVQRICDVFAGFVIVWGFISTLTVLFSCNPISENWDMTHPNQCINRMVFWYFNSIVNILTDIIIYIIPLPILRTLSSIGRVQKYILVGIFCLGFFTCVISVVRITRLYAAIMSTDPPWHTIEVAIWSVVELSCAVVCVCIPTLRPLLPKGLASSGTPQSAKLYRWRLPWTTNSGASAEVESQQPTPQLDRDTTCTGTVVALGKLVSPAAEVEAPFACAVAH